MRVPRDPAALVNGDAKGRVVGRPGRTLLIHAVAAGTGLEKIRDVTAGVKTRVEATLKDSLAALNSA